MYIDQKALTSEGFGSQALKMVKCYHSQTLKTLSPEHLFQSAGY